MATCRNLNEVLAAMIAEVPEDHSFRYALQTQLETVMFSSPESMPIRWKETYVVIRLAFKEHTSPDTLPPWGQNVMAIWLNKV